MPSPEKPPLKIEDVLALEDIQILQVHHESSYGLSYLSFCQHIGRSNLTADTKALKALKERFQSLENKGLMERSGSTRHVTRAGEKMLILAGKIAEHRPVNERIYCGVPYLLWQAAVDRWGKTEAESRLNAAVLDGFEERIKKALEDL